MSLKKRGGIWHFSFYVAGRRYRGSTLTSKRYEARIIESKAMAKAEEGASNVRRKPPTLREFAPEFFAHKEKLTHQHQLAASSLRYYSDGWKLLATDRIAGMRLDHIRTPHATELYFHSPTNTNRALRTLRCILFYAKAVGVLTEVPKIHCLQQPRRERTMTPKEEKKFLTLSSPVLTDVMITILDAGPRPSEVLAFRWEHFNFLAGTIFIPNGKTRNSRRFIPMSSRMAERFLARYQRAERPEEGWVFPTIRGSRSGHKEQGVIQHEFQRIREALKLGEDVVIYCLRHTFATDAVRLTGNLHAVSRQLGHAQISTTTIYTHRQGGDQIRDAINIRNADLGTNSVTSNFVN